MKKIRIWLLAMILLAAVLLAGMHAASVSRSHYTPPLGPARLVG